MYLERKIQQIKYESGICRLKRHKKVQLTYLEVRKEKGRYGLYV